MTCMSKNWVLAAPTKWWGSGTKQIASIKPSPTKSEADLSATQSCNKRDSQTDLKMTDLSDAVFGVSNLKRAIQTLLIFLSGVSKTDGGSKREIHILSALQERSMGTDAVSTLDKGAVPDAEYLGGVVDIPEKTFYAQLSENVDFNKEYNKGNNWWNTRGGLNPWSNMFGDFCQWVNEVSGENPTKPVLVAGHSSWLKKFFKSKLANKGNPNLAEELLQGGSKIGYKIKLGNASMIKFELKVWEGGCSITRRTTQLILGKWQVHRGGWWSRNSKKDEELIMKIKQAISKEAELRGAQAPTQGEGSLTPETQCPIADLGDV